MENERSRLWMEPLFPAPLTEEEYCRRENDLARQAYEEFVEENAPRLRERVGEKFDELLDQQDDLKLLGYEREWEGE